MTTSIETLSTTALLNELISRGILSMDLVEVERSQVLKALTALTADGVFRKVGLVGGVEKPTTEVNAFQIRYIFDAAVPAPEAPAEEVAEEGK